MKRLSLRPLALLFLASCLSSGIVFSNSALGQGARDLAPGDNQPAGNLADDSANTPDKEWYYGPTPEKKASKPLGRQKAELRARQRLARMESMRWYGFSASRPTAAGIPFTTMYSPAWTRPGGRPFAWYTSQRPVVVVSPYYPSYYR